jgi:hypothetical protein
MATKWSPPVFQIRHHCRFWRAPQNGRMSPFSRLMRIPQSTGISIRRTDDHAAGAEGASKRTSPRRDIGYSWRIQRMGTKAELFRDDQKALRPRQPRLLDDLPSAESGRSHASACLPRAGGRFECWQQKAARDSKTRSLPSALAAEMEGQIRLINAQSGPSPKPDSRL